MKGAGETHYRGWRLGARIHYIPGDKGPLGVEKGMTAVMIFSGFDFLMNLHRPPTDQALRTDSSSCMDFNNLKL